MSVSAPQNMTEIIDQIGNAIATLCSDPVALQHACNALEHTSAGLVYKTLQTHCPTWESKAIFIKGFLAGNFLRLLQFAIYADDVVEESELDAAYPFLKPLAYIYSIINPDRYKRFENLDRSNVTAFINSHIQETGIMGGNIRFTKEYAANKDKIATISHNPGDLVALELENGGLVLWCTMALFMESKSKMFDMLQYVLIYVLTNGIAGSIDEFELLVRQGNNKVANFNPLEMKRATGFLNIIQALIKSQATKIASNIKALPAAVQYCHDIMSRISIPTTSHFPATCFVGANSPSVSTSTSFPVMSYTPVTVQEEKTPEKMLEDALEELNALEGLPAVKAEVGKFVSYLKIQKERERQGMKVSSQALHYVFTGNPGTGKTTVARILAKIFYGFGILKSQKLTETDRSGLVGGYVGQTAIKTDELIQKSLDGVLFIDEAYTLEKRGSDSDYGQEAIDTLLKRMEDYRDRLIVIVAGYPDLMKEFLVSNPGLSSRFTRFLAFEDYTPPEMCRIFGRLCKDDEYKVTSAAFANACILFRLAHYQKNEHFGNGRFVRNIYENTTMKQSSRLTLLKQITKQALSTLEAEDIPFEMISGFETQNLNFAESRWNVVCPNCQKQIVAPLELIGRNVTCKCGHKFACPWWNPVPETIEGVRIEIFQ